jgi:hypothetical protein
MHPSQLVDETALLLSQVMRFEYPADGVVSRHFRAQRSLGPRERATIADAIYAVLRYKPRYEYFAQSGAGPQLRRMALLGLAQANSLPMELACQANERACSIACLLGWLMRCTTNMAKRCSLLRKACCNLRRLMCV